MATKKQIPAKSGKSAKSSAKSVSKKTVKDDNVVSKKTELVKPVTKQLQKLAIQSTN